MRRKKTRHLSGPAGNKEGLLRIVAIPAALILLLAAWGLSGLGGRGTGPHEKPVHAAGVQEPLGPQLAAIPAPPANPAGLKQSYAVELKKWGIHNDGTEAAATTKGINQALRYARDNRFGGILLPAGTYLIDKDSRIEMVSHMRFELDPDAVLQKEANSREQYETLYIGENVSDVTIKGGTYRGDREEHDYRSDATHEYGYGISILGSSNVVIDGVAASHFTGDGINISGSDRYIDTLDARDLEPGGIDASGKAVPDSGKIRSKNKKKTGLTAALLGGRKALQVARPVKLDKDSRFEVYFYTAAGKFMKAEKNLEFAYSNIPVPTGAGYYRIVLQAKTVKDVSVGIYAQLNAFNIAVLNSDIGFNRRQGISVSGAEKVRIENNLIHDMSGTAPESGVDLEGGYMPNQNIQIADNYFYNNKAYDIILFDGKDATVTGNRIESKDAIGLASTENFQGAAVRNNRFSGNKIFAGEQIIFSGNTLDEVYAKFTGPQATIDGMYMRDSSLTLEAKTAMGITAANIRMVNTGKQEHALIVNGEAVKLTDVTITGPTGLRSLSGKSTATSEFTRLTVSGYNSRYGLDLPAGTYRNAVFQADGGGTEGPVITKSGVYVFESSRFTSTGTGLKITHSGASVVLNKSAVTVTGPISYGSAAVYAHAARSLTLTDNEIRAEGLTSENVAMVKINEYGADGKPGDVQKAVIQGNRITTNLAAWAISTIDAGEGIPAYTVSDNVLIKGKLELRPEDNPN